MFWRAPRSTLFPYTTLFRSDGMLEYANTRDLVEQCTFLIRKYRPDVVLGPRRGGICRSEEHTSELQSRFDLVCRLLLEKKKSTLFHSIVCTSTSLVSSSLWL